VLCFFLLKRAHIFPLPVKALDEECYVKLKFYQIKPELLSVVTAFIVSQRRASPTPVHVPLFLWLKIPKFCLLGLSSY